MIIIIFILLLIIYIYYKESTNSNNNFTIISNTCVGYLVLQKFDKIYNNPFIGSIFINDDDYIKLVNNFTEYINYKPKLYIPNNNKYKEQTNSNYYIHDLVKIPYPVFLLNDIEIHYVHENNNNVALEKYYRRLNRLKNIINNKNKIFITLSFSQFINKHDNYELIIDKFLEKSSNKNIIKIFIGPPQFYKKEYGEYYITINEWTNFSFERNKSNIFINNDENFCVNKIKEIIYKYI
jgi:uncharacterized protein (DUF1919 family)